MKKNKIFAVSFGGVLTALSVVILYMGNIPFVEYIASIFSGIAAFFGYLEFGGKTGMLIYAACGLLSMLLSPSKEPAILYVFIFGYYPIVKSSLEKRIKFKVLRIVIKFLIFNIAVSIAYAILIFLFKLPVDTIGNLGNWTLLVLLGILNIMFVVYDISLKSYGIFYLKILQPKLYKIFKIK